MTVLPSVIDDDALVQEDRVHGSVYTSQEIFAAEVEQIFHRTWMYVAHASEVPEPGDSVVRQIGRQPVIVSRDEDGQVHLLLNRCRHRANASCLSHFAIFRTTTAGESHVYAVGHYEDSFVKQDGRWWYAKHRVVVHTRMLEISTHVPF